MHLPKKTIAFLRWFCREDYIEEIEGDLTEIFRKEYENAPRLSYWKFTWRVTTYLRPEFLKPMKDYYPQNSLSIYKSYFKVGCRNLIRNRSFSIINLIGLTMGLSICLTLLTVVSDELGYDKFHKDPDKIYRVLGELTESTGDKLTFCRVPYDAVHIARQISSIEKASAIIPFNAKIKIHDSKGSFREFNSSLSDFRFFFTTAIADPTYFQLFKYEWLAGSESDALASPNSVVITESRAKLYFKELEPHQILGKSIVYEDSLIAQVTGVVKDFSENSDLKFTDFLSSASLNNGILKKHFNIDGWTQRTMNTWVFVKLRGSEGSLAVESMLNLQVNKNKSPDFKLALTIEPITNIHFNSRIIENPIRTADLTTLYVLAIIGLLILLLAILNFINLNTAIFLKHLKEAAVRKIIGSSRLGLLQRFLSETLIILFIASALALISINPILNTFESYVSASINPLLRWENLLWISLFFIMVITLLAAVSFKVIVSVPPAQGIKGVANHISGTQSFTQKVLTIFQFSISVAFIIGSLVVGRQVEFIRNKDLGFRTNAIVTLRAPQGEAPKLKVFASEVTRNSRVVNAVLQWQSPIHENPRGMKIRVNSSDDSDFWVTQIAGDENYIPLYEIKLLSGRNLNQTDTVSELVINEMLMKRIGIQKPGDALGKLLYWNDKPYPIVGVVADFHTLNLHSPTEPLCIINRGDRHGEVAIKLRGASVNDLKTGLSEVEKVWHAVFGSAEFEYRFLDDSIAHLYLKEKKTATMMNIATAVAILISCIGLFGLVAFMIERRTKEIGIRKILGASITGIVSLFLTNFAKLIFVSVIIAAPIAYFFMDRWLNEFAYHIQLEWWLFVVSGLIVIIIAAATVGFQTIKASMANPVKSLRSE